MHTSAARRFAAHYSRQASGSRVPSSLAEMRACFPIVHEHTVEFRDLDAMQHVNNATYFQIFEKARIAALSALTRGKACFKPEGIAPVLAGTWCRFRRPLEIDDKLLIGVRADSILPARGEFEHHYVVWSSQHHGVAAQGGATIVVCDFDNGAKRTPLPDNWVRAWFSNCACHVRHSSSADSASCTGARAGPSDGGAVC